MPAGFGKLLIVAGVILIVVGLLFTFRANIPWLGRLPGDIHIKRDNVEFYFPLATSLLISAVLSLLFYLFRK